MTAPAPDWRAIRDRVQAIAREADRLAAALPAPLVEVFCLNVTRIAGEAEAAEQLILGIEPGDDPAFDAEASVAEVWQLAAAATVAQVAAIQPIMSAAVFAAPNSLN